MIFANGIVLFMFAKRRDLQPIRVKGWKLVFMSLLGNLCIVIMDIVIKILRSYIIENDTIVSLSDFTPNAEFPFSDETEAQYSNGSCFAQSLRFCFFFPLFIVPYFLRGIRLLKIFQQHKEYVMKKRRTGIVQFEKFERSYCIRETNLAAWFLGIMFILLCFFGVNVYFDYKFN